MLAAPEFVRPESWLSVLPLGAATSKLMAAPAIRLACAEVRFAVLSCGLTKASSWLPVAPSFNDAVSVEASASAVTALVSSAAGLAPELLAAGRRGAPTRAAAATAGEQADAVADKATTASRGTAQTSALPAGQRLMTPGTLLPRALQPKPRIRRFPQGGPSRAVPACPYRRPDGLVAAVLAVAPVTWSRARPCSCARRGADPAAQVQELLAKVHAAASQGAKRRERQYEHVLCRGVASSVEPGDQRRPGQQPRAVRGRERSDRAR